MLWAFDDSYQFVETGKVCCGSFSNLYIGYRRDLLMEREEEQGVGIQGVSVLADKIPNE